MSLEGFYDSLMDVLTVTPTGDSMGNNTEVESTKAAGVPCRVRVTTAQFRTVNDRGEWVYTHSIRCAADVALDEKDRLKWVSRAGVAIGKTLKIRSLTPAADLAGAHHQQVLAYEER